MRDALTEQAQDEIRRAKENRKNYPNNDQSDTPEVQERIPDEVPAYSGYERRYSEKSSEEQIASKSYSSRKGPKKLLLFSLLKTE